MKNENVSIVTSGTTEIQINWEKQEVEAWYDDSYGEGGEGLPKGFILTDNAGRKITDILLTLFEDKNFLGEQGQFITFPYEIIADTHPYEIFTDTQHGTFNVMLGNHLIKGQLSEEGDIVLDTELSPKEAYQWLIAIVYNEFFLSIKTPLATLLIERPLLFESFLKLPQEQARWIKAMLDGTTFPYTYSLVAAKVLKYHEFELFTKLVLRMQEEFPDRLFMLLEIIIDNESVKDFILWREWIMKHASNKSIYRNLYNQIHNISISQYNKLLAHLITLWKDASIGEQAEAIFWEIIKKTEEAGKGYLADIIAETPQILQAFINLPDEKRKNLIRYLVKKARKKGYNKLAITLLARGEDKLFWDIINCAFNKDIQMLKPLWGFIATISYSEQLLQYFAHLPQPQRQKFIDMLLEVTIANGQPYGYSELAVLMLAYGHEQMFLEMITNEKITTKKNNPLRYLTQYFYYNEDALEQFILMNADKKKIVIEIIEKFANKNALQQIKKKIEKLILQHPVDELSHFTVKLIRTYLAINKDAPMPDKVKEKINVWLSHIQNKSIDIINQELSL